ncbi:FERM domain-containing protein 6 isoform X2 [Silurus meridionalis]|uniref:FERM domain-containing protein 6 isoform X2 n=1 Tax=Silurus meridionalis TaxID=175797 RepID=UPI001EEADFB9|nr:FERM domain-containing protein 6 isoform X2 [Silurus meridionalis]
MLNKGKNSQQIRVLCVVVLPNKMEIHITVGLKCRGREVISHLSQILGINDLHLFGLSFQKDKDQLFLDLDKKLTAYFPKTCKQTTLPDRIVLYLRIQYYIRNIHQIVDENVCSLYCADLKNKVLSSQCYEQEGLYFQLAAYALQADLGDWKEGVGPYFSPQDYFPTWHTPDLHRELKGMSAHDASLLFIDEAYILSDVPLTFYSMSKGKKDKKMSLLIGLALTGLHIYDKKRASGEYQLSHEFAWSSIECLKFQGRRFEIRADSLAGEVLVMYTQSVLHSRHLLKHMSNTHHVHLNTKHSIKQLQREERRQQMEMYIKDSTDPDSEESENELPSIKCYLDKTRQNQATITIRDLTNLDEIELCVDEPEEMLVDDPEEIIHLKELLEGVSVDGPPLVTLSQWTDFTIEMKQVLRWRACNPSLNQYEENVNLNLSNKSPEEHVSTQLTDKHEQEDFIF